MTNLRKLLMLKPSSSRRRKTERMPIRPRLRKNPREDKTQLITRRILKGKQKLLTTRLRQPVSQPSLPSLKQQRPNSYKHKPRLRRRHSHHSRRRLMKLFREEPRVILGNLEQNTEKRKLKQMKSKEELMLPTIRLVPLKQNGHELT